MEHIKGEMVENGDVQLMVWIIYEIVGGLMVVCGVVGLGYGIR